VVFQGFEPYEHEIKSISFTNYAFCDEVLQALVQSLSFSKCFRALVSFAIDNVTGGSLLFSFMCQLVTCDWVLEKRNLATGVARNSELDISPILRPLTQLDTGKVNTDLSGNSLSKPLNPQNLKPIQWIANLSFAKARFE
jgi:hypothetical protein